MGMIHQKNNRLIWEDDGEKLWIEPWGRSALRVRATYLAAMPDENWALLEQAGAKDCDIKIGNGQATIRNGCLTAEISNGAIAFFNAGGKRLLQEQWRVISEGLTPVSALQIKARELKPTIGGDYALSLRFEPNPGEKIYGMGQYQDGCLDKKGCVLELAQRNAQASVPFAVSTQGYGFLWNVNCNCKLNSWETG